MNFSVRQTLAVLLLVGLSSTLAGQPAPAARVWRAGVETNSAPYTYRDPAGAPAGFSVDLLRTAARAEGLSVEFQLLDWGELLAAFKAGRIDIICNVADTPGRSEIMRFSTTTMAMRGTLFQRRGEKPVRTVADLAHLRLATPRDSRAHEFARTRAWDVEFVFAPSLTDCVDAVHAGRADLLLAAEIVTNHLIREKGFADLVPAALQFPDFAYREHFGVSPDQPELLAQLNEGLSAAHQDGTYNQLHEKWLGPLDRRQLSWRDVQPYLPLLILVAGVALGAILWQRRLLRQLSRQAREIQEKEERLRLVFEGSQDAFWDWDVAAGHVLRSPRWAGMLGYTLAEIGPLRQSFLDLIHPDDQAGVVAHEKSLWAGQDHFEREMRMKAKAGGWKWILDRGKVVARDPVSGTPRRITGTHTDITERKSREEEAVKLQRKMQEAQKLESLGVLAGGIAHDFNNLLTVVLGNSALARLESADSPVNAARLDSVLTAASRAAELCRQLLAYAGKGSFAIERINLNELVTETTRLLELSISKQARLEFSLAPTLPKIEADPTQVRQIIMNLVMNASEALENRPGTIRISTSRITLDRPETAPAPLLSEVAAGEYVCVEIVDTGSGMTAEVQGRIFDPFFSTKFTGRGLGLAAVIGIVRTHRGLLKVQSAPGRGSTFRVYLPISSTQTAHPFLANVAAPRKP